MELYTTGVFKALLYGLGSLFITNWVRELPIIELINSETQVLNHTSHDHAWIANQVHSNVDFRPLCLIKRTDRQLLFSIYHCTAITSILKSFKFSRVASSKMKQLTGILFVNSELCPTKLLISSVETIRTDPAYRTKQFRASFWVQPERATSIWRPTLKKITR